MQIEPRSYYTLFRGLEDHQDAGTYYIQAVIRDGQTAVLIDTVNLTDNGNREFSKQWQAPHDPNGNGRYITITYSVYTDSGYTTKSENYGDRFEEHEVRHRPEDVRMPSGDDVDYKKIQRMIEESLAKFKTNFEPVKVENKIVNLQPVLKAIVDNKVEIPPQKEVDMKPMMQEMATLKMGIADLAKRPPFEKTDLTDIKNSIETLDNSITSKFGELSEKILSAIKEVGKNVIEKITEVLEFEKNIEYIIPNKSENLPKTKSTDYISTANKMAEESDNE